MMKGVIKNVRLNGELTDIVYESGVIKHIGKCELDGEDFGGAEIYPGLIDIHSHGCIGEDTMDGSLDKMARWQLEHGITTWYPTTMTMSEEKIIAATQAELDIDGGAHLPGFHMEGPFINERYRGAQNPAYIKAPDMELFRKCKNIKMVTVAPELEGAEEFIKNCPAVISLGHTDADFETTKHAIELGARCLTHTFNAMPPIHHRAPGPIGAASDDGRVYAQLICDGRHVHPSSVRMLVKLFGYDRVILISDSMEATGLCDGNYTLGGLPITVKDGCARTESGALAGSTTNLFDCVRCAISFGIPKSEAVRMASENPARLMGLNKGKIEVGYDADFIIVNESFELIRAIAAK